jgi:hypothetical protein
MLNQFTRRLGIPLVSQPHEALVLASDFDLAVSTPDHFIPLLYTAGLAAAETDAQALMRAMPWDRFQ